MILKLNAMDASTFSPRAPLFPCCEPVFHPKDASTEQMARYQAIKIALENNDWDHSLCDDYLWAANLECKFGKGVSVSRRAVDVMDKNDIKVSHSKCKYLCLLNILVYNDHCYFDGDKKKRPHCDKKELDSVMKKLLRGIKDKVQWAAVVYLHASTMSSTIEKLCKEEQLKEAAEILRGSPEVAKDEALDNWFRQLTLNTKLSILLRGC